MILDPREIDAPPEHEDPPRRCGWLAFVLALVGLGCAHPLPRVTVPIAPQSIEAAQVDAVVHAWSERADLPELDVEQLRDVRITDAVDELEYARACPPSVECSPRWNPCAGPLGIFCGRIRITVIPPETQRGTRLSAIRHGLIHHAIAIAGEGPDVYHHDRRLWPYRMPQGAERDATVEWRARAIARTR